MANYEGHGPHRLIVCLRSGEPAIALMGNVGVGKTYFALQATEGKLQPSWRPEPFTTPSPSPTALSNVQEFEYWDPGLNTRITMIDSPGFDDPEKPDLVVLGEFFDHLQTLAPRGLKLCGIVYFHRINDTRVFGSAQRTLALFAKMVGPQLKSVRLCTTMWDQVDAQTGASRENQLTRKFWKSLIDKGAQVTRFEGTTYSARHIIASLMRPTLGNGMSSGMGYDNHIQSRDHRDRDMRGMNRRDSSSNVEENENETALRLFDSTLEELKHSCEAIQRQLSDPHIQDFYPDTNMAELSNQFKKMNQNIRTVEALKTRFLEPGNTPQTAPQQQQQRSQENMSATRMPPAFQTQFGLLQNAENTEDYNQFSLNNNQEQQLPWNGELGANREPVLQDSHPRSSYPKPGRPKRGMPPQNTYTPGVYEYS